MTTQDDPPARACRRDTTFDVALSRAIVPLADAIEVAIVQHDGQCYVPWLPPEHEKQVRDVLDAVCVRLRDDSGTHLHRLLTGTLGIVVGNIGSARCGPPELMEAAPGKLRIIASQLERLGESVKVEPVARSTASTPSRLEWLAKAMLTVKEYPEWSDRAIAKKAGVDPSTLSRSAEYQEMARLSRQPRG